LLDCATMYIVLVTQIYERSYLSVRPSANMSARDLVSGLKPMEYLFFSFISDILTKIYLASPIFSHLTHNDVRVF